MSYKVISSLDAKRCVRKAPKRGRCFSIRPAANARPEGSYKMTLYSETVGAMNINAKRGDRLALAVNDGGFLVMARADKDSPTAFRLSYNAKGVTVLSSAYLRRFTEPGIYNLIELKDGFWATDCPWKEKETNKE